MLAIFIRSHDVDGAHIREGAVECFMRLRASADFLGQRPPNCDQVKDFRSPVLRFCNVGSLTSEVELKVPALKFSGEPGECR